VAADARRQTGIALCRQRIRSRKRTSDATHTRRRPTSNNCIEPTQRRMNHPASQPASSRSHNTSSLSLDNYISADLRNATAAFVLGACWLASAQLLN